MNGTIRFVGEWLARVEKAGLDPKLVLEGGLNIEKEILRKPTAKPDRRRGILARIDFDAETVRGYVEKELRAVEPVNQKARRLNSSPNVIRNQMRAFGIKTNAFRARPGIYSRKNRLAEPKVVLWTERSRTAMSRPKKNHRPAQRDEAVVPELEKSYEFLRKRKNKSKELTSAEKEARKAEKEKARAEREAKKSGISSEIIEYRRWKWGRINPEDKMEEMSSEEKRRFIERTIKNTRTAPQMLEEAKRNMGEGRLREARRDAWRAIPRKRSLKDRIFRRG
ncbi:MAG: hypothetical protein V1911_00170 [Candidatus Micrarchaeota archaeon]